MSILNFKRDNTRSGTGDGGGCGGGTTVQMAMVLYELKHGFTTQVYHRLIKYQSSESGYEYKFMETPKEECLTFKNLWRPSLTYILQHYKVAGECVRADEKILTRGNGILI